MSARKLAARYRAGSAGETWLRLPVGGPPLREVPRRPALTLIQKLPLER
jgi:hypothetical protein